MRAVIAGGGTGGHVIPALAIAHELRDGYHAEVTFIGTARGIENRLVPKAGYSLELIKVGALKNVSLATRISTLLALPSAIVDAWQIIGELRPEIVIGVGGYASGPGMLAAALSGRPTLAFEPNVVPGFANRVIAPLVSAAAVHFEQTCRYFRRCQVTGVPVRRAFFDIPPRSLGPPTLLVFGGSQGASAINRTVMQCLPTLLAAVPDLHIIHQTGERDHQEVQRVYLEAGVSAEITAFIEQMPDAFCRADLLLCRSGASTVAEVAAAGKPAIFVPFPHAADDHQRRNAEAFERAGAAVLIPEAELNAQRLTEAITSLLNDRPRLASMSQASRALAHPDAARQIAALAARLAGWQAAATA
ncbi:MAG TPA: undecaprenyldiphospho-muramoylpentapeptide beta-N-acetylglucosaminyltransferase [Terriglobales bacterium]|nr:undecaprenyldiphospho-muramoylpentapeptide beta-N-acetylglucosaminyltransferase [Terriglobales bacterium]